MANGKKKVLVIEDSHELADILCEALKQAGFEVIAAHDGETGYQMAIGEMPDIVLLDIILPKMDGLTLLQKLRSSDAGKATPVIILSNLDDAETVSDAMQNGVFNFLLKSDWEIGDVVSKVQQKLDEAEREKEEE